MPTFRTSDGETGPPGLKSHALTLIVIVCVPAGGVGVGVGVGEGLCGSDVGVSVGETVADGVGGLKPGGAGTSSVSRPARGASAPVPYAASASSEASVMV